MAGIENIHPDSSLLPSFDIQCEDDVFPMAPIKSQTLPCAAKCSLLDVIAGDFQKLKDRKQSTSTPSSTRTDSKLVIDDDGEDSALGCSVNLTASFSNTSTSLHSDNLSSSNDTSVTYSDIRLSLAKVSLSQESLNERDCTLTFDSGIDFSWNSTESKETSERSPCISKSFDFSSSFSSSGISTSSSLDFTRSLSSSGISTSASLDLTRSFSSDDSFISRLLEKYCPKESDRLIGRKMGLGVLDILSELDNRNINVVGDILSLLSPQDLCR